MLELVPKPNTIACEKPLMVAQGLAPVQAHRVAGSTSPPCSSNPSRTVTTHNPSAARVLARLHALQMLAAMSEAMPIGEVHRTTVTILLMTRLNTCTSSHDSLYTKVTDAEGSWTSHEADPDESTPDDVKQAFVEQADAWSIANCHLQSSSQMYNPAGQP